MSALLFLADGLKPEHWFVLGVALFGVELLTGTTYLLWPAVAAALTGALTLAVPIAWPLQLGVFALLSVALIVFARPIVLSLRSDAPALNERGLALIGQRGAAAEDFVAGIGAVKINDSVWRAVSDETVRAGASVEVLSVDGVTLKVKPAA